MLDFRRPWVILILLFLFFFVELDGQNLKTIDSLKAQLRLNDPSRRFDLLNALGFEYRYSFPDSTIYYCNQAYELGKELKLNKDLSKPLSFIGLAAANKGDYKNSFDYHNEAIEVALQQNDSVQLAYGYNNLGRMFFDQGDYVRAYTNFIRSKDLFDAIRDKTGLAYVYRSLSGVYRAQGNFVESLTAARKALDLRQQVGDPRAVASSWMELGLIQQAHQQKQAALTSFMRADSVASKVNDLLTKAEVKMGMSEVMYEDGDHAGAFTLAREILGLVSENTNQKLFIRASLIMAKYYFDLKTYDQALPILKLILAESERNGNVNFQKEAVSILAQLFEAQKKKILAMEYKDRLAVLDEILQNTDLERQIDMLQFQLEIEKKERENELLKANKAKNEALIEQQQFNNLLLIILVGTVSIVSIIIIRSNRKRKLINQTLELKNQYIVKQQEEIARRNTELSRRNEDLRQLNHEKDTLMNIVAHDLKSPLNQIRGLISLVEMEDKEGQKQYLEYVKSATQSGLDLITDLLDVTALEVVPERPTLTEVSFLDLLEDRIVNFRAAAAAKSILLQLSVSDMGLIMSNEIYLNRILDNLISNAIKFSPRNTVVQIFAEVRGNTLRFGVHDQGPGFSEEDKEQMFQKFKKLSARPTGGESSNGLGLAIVKTLVERMNGKIELISAVNEGSKFIIDIPLGRNPASVKLKSESK